MPLLSVDQLEMRFGERLIQTGVTFQVEKGTIFAIMGGSGCGKSTLLKHMVGLLPPAAGSVSYNGVDYWQCAQAQQAQLRAGFGMLFQSAALFDSMTVAENVGFAFRRNKGMSESEIRKRVAEALEVVELGGIENKKPSELSGGMRKRVGLARAIVYQPQIVLYDEPTTGLDPIVSDSIDKLIMRVRDRFKVTSVVVTHDMRSARRVGNHVLMLHDKKIYANCTPESLFASTDPVVRQFIDGVADPQEIQF